MQQLDSGYVRLSLKALDDKTPTLLPVSVTVSNGTINQIANIDPRTAFFIRSSLTRDSSFTASNAHDGLLVKSNAIGSEASFDLGGGWSAEDRLRKTFNSGRFIGLFPSDNAANGLRAHAFFAQRAQQPVAEKATVERGEERGVYAEPRQPDRDVEGRAADAAVERHAGGRVGDREHVEQRFAADDDGHGRVCANVAVRAPAPAATSAGRRRARCARPAAARGASARPTGRSASQDA